jgi:hypothetical protein
MVRSELATTMRRTPCVLHLAALALPCLQACAGGATSDPLTGPPVPGSSVPPGCEAAVLPDPLDRYDAITAGAMFSLELVHDARGAWVPGVQLEMPLHHASTIEWRARELLEPHAGGRVVVVATGEGRTSIVHDPQRNTWFATYAARIERVCPVAPAPP